MKELLPAVGSKVAVSFSRRFTTDTPEGTVLWNRVTGMEFPYSAVRLDDGRLVGIWPGEWRYAR